MSLIPTFTTLKVEDFPDQRSWIGKLFFPLNNFVLGAISAVNGNLLLGQNIPCQTKTLSFTWNGQSQLPVSFAYTLPSTLTPVELRICSAFENSKAITLLCSWSYANSQVSLTNLWKVVDGTTPQVSRLTVGNTYTFTVRLQP